ncbi:class I adenylate-forming enzyme family protein [Intestinimonas butyriciproducens]|uniref:class I adenylate-forming enzyme family protein n=1 Tax=Intestinimonas butyriciproducens TaxID=1297617 RepID=UPI00242EF70C
MENVPLIWETAATLTARNARQWPEKTAFLFDDRAWSWQTVEDTTDRIALAMLKMGIGKGTHLGFWSMNTIDLVLYLIAAMKIGAVAAVINYSYRNVELRSVLRRADVEAVFLGTYKNGSDYAAIVEEVRPDCPALRAVYQMDAGAAAPGREDGLQWVQAAKAAVTPEDVATITFTSGTTKEPKPVMLTHSNIINDVNQFTHRMRVSVENGDVLMAPLPLFHSSGISGMLFFALVVGLPTLIHCRFTAEQSLRDIEKYKVTALLAVPTMLDLMIRSEHFRAYDLSSLRVVQTSGSATSPDKLKRITSELGLECMLIGYGQTECSPLITTILYDDDLETMANTVGVPFPHEEIRIWDLARDRPAGPGETGEIQVKGFNTMKGYYNFPEEQAKKYTADGWLKTTDAGFLDGRGYLHFVSRISENIIRHGENIAPAEVESVIEQYSEEILHVKVVGVPDPVVQEEVACLIQTRGAEIDARDLRRFVKARLASYKVPKYVFCVEAFPMTDTGKIDQAAVKQLAAELAAERRT